MIIFLSKVHRWTRLKAKGEQAPRNRNSPFSVINYITSTFLSITRSRRFPTRSVPFQREKEKEEKGREKRNLRKDAYFYRVTRIPPAWKKMEERERRGPLSFERLFKEMIARNANDRFLAASKNCATKFALFNPRQTIKFDANKSTALFVPLRSNRFMNFHNRVVKFQNFKMNDSFFFFTNNLTI